jgi:hypothetical protein
MSPVRQRYDVVTCVVTKHVRYGLVVEIDSGEQGWIDSGYIADSAGQSSPSAWPSPGSTLAAVVLGMDRMGRVRLASRPSYVELIRSGARP